MASSPQRKRRRAVPAHHIFGDTSTCRAAGEYAFSRGPAMPALVPVTGASFLPRLVTDVEARAPHIFRRPRYSRAIARSRGSPHRAGMEWRARFGPASAVRTQPSTWGRIRERRSCRHRIHFGVHGEKETYAIAPFVSVQRSNA
jgi:hypothetical protein